MSANKKIFMTGSDGTVGKALRHELLYEITSFDLSDGCDARNYDQVLTAMSGHDVVIHLAWNTSDHNAVSGQVDFDDYRQTRNVLQAAIAAGVPRVILASSVHADTYIGRTPGEILDPYALAVPDSPYGTSKIDMETEARRVAVDGLEVICIRLGHVTPDGRPAESPADMRAVWISHQDLSELFTRCIEIEDMPTKEYSGIHLKVAIVYAVSDNPGRVQDISNTFGWWPKDAAPII